MIVTNLHKSIFFLANLEEEEEEESEGEDEESDESDHDSRPSGKSRGGQAPNKKRVGNPAALGAGNNTNTPPECKQS